MYGCFLAHPVFAEYSVSAESRLTISAILSASADSEICLFGQPLLWVLLLSWVLLAAELHTKQLDDAGAL